MNASQTIEPPILLSTGRLILHTRETNGSTLATPETGARELTETEWEEYCAKLTARKAQSGFHKVKS